VVQAHGGGSVQSQASAEVKAGRQSCAIVWSREQRSLPSTAALLLAVPLEPPSRPPPLLQQAAAGGAQRRLLAAGGEEPGRSLSRKMAHDAVSSMPPLPRCSSFS